MKFEIKCCFDEFDRRNNLRSCNPVEPVLRVCNLELDAFAGGSCGLLRQAVEAADPVDTRNRTRAIDVGFAFFVCFALKPSRRALATAVLVRLVAVCFAVPASVELDNRPIPLWACVGSFGLAA